MVFDFFKNLGRSRISGAQARVMAKQYSVVAKAKSKASSKFNRAIDAPMEAVQNKAKGVANKVKPGIAGPAQQQQKQQQSQQQDTKGSGGMGLFGKKKIKGQAGAVAVPGGQQAAMMPMDGMAGGGDKTVAISIDGLVEQQSQECVGWIVCMTGDQKGRDFRLVAGKNRIGTAADNDVVLTDQYLSSKHCTINYENGRYTVVDLDSTNGTYVNQKRVTKEEIIDNDTIRLGRTELRFKALY